MKKNISRFALLSILMLVHINLIAQTSNPQWLNYSTDSYINKIACYGNYVWSATRGGLARLDRTTGQTTVFNCANSGIAHNYLYTIEVDVAGNVWCGSINDLSKFDGTNWTVFHILPTGDTLIGVENITTDRNGNVWFTDDWDFTPQIKSIFKYDGSTFTKYPNTFGSVSKIKTDTLNNLWMSTSSGLVKYDGINWTTYNTSNTSLQSVNIYSFDVDKKNNIWMSVIDTLNQFLTYKFDGASWIQYPFPAHFGHLYAAPDNHIWYYSDTINNIVELDDTTFISHPPLPHYISAFNIDSIGHTWVGYYSFSLINPDPQNKLNEFDGTMWHSYNVSNSPLNNGYIMKIIMDAHGNKWMNPDGCGLVKFDGYNWTSYTTLNSGIIANGWIDFAFDLSGNLWICRASIVAAYLQKFDGNIWTTVNLSTNDPISRIVPDRVGNVWLGTNGGLAKFDGVNWTYYNELNSGLLDNAVSIFTFDHSNNLWLDFAGGSGAAGIQKFDGTNWTTFNTGNSGLTNDNCDQLFCDKQNNIWITCGNGDLNRFDGTNWTFYNSSNSGLNDWPFSMTQDSSNNYWIATSSSITKFDGTNWTYYNAYNSGSGGGTNQIVIDDYNNKWFSSNGVGVFNENGISVQSIYNLGKQTISGNVFYDTNSNGIKDSITDFGMGTQHVMIYPDSIMNLTNWSGDYSFFRLPGSYQTSFIPYQNWLLTSDSSAYHILIDTVSLGGFDFAAAPTQFSDNVEVYLTAGGSRCYALTPYWIDYLNNGSTVLNGYISFVKSNQLTYVSSTPAPTSISGDTLIWNFTNLHPFEHRQIIIEAVNSGTVGDSVNSSANVFLNQNLFDSDSVSKIISCSFDPNKKEVSPIGFSSQHITSMQDTLVYTIHFQNTGNDTAFTVQIKDTMNQALDLSTFTVVGSSHPVNVSYTNVGIATFYFDSILLPPYSVNDPGSIGFVKYKINPKSGLPDYSIVTNNAFIYFDFNDAIETNSVFNTLVYGVTGMETQQKTNHFKIYPNPFSNELNVQCNHLNSKSTSVKVYNSTGAVIYTNKFFTPDFSIKINTLPEGIYLIELKNEESVERFKVVKE